jgi:hypothetical protein
MTKMLLHVGGQEVTRETIQSIPIPAQTDSYMPVPHIQLIDTLSTIGQDLLNEYTLESQTLALARDGKQLFAFLSFKTGDRETALSFAFRNSYDKSMSIGFAAGMSVFICDNLALTGDIVVMKKHTKNVFKEIENSAITTLYKARGNYQGLLADKDKMKTQLLTDDNAFRAMGLLFGKGILSPRQLPVVLKEWQKPSHDEFQEKNVWSLYNAVTEVMKTAPPLEVMERTVNLHKLAMSDLVYTDDIIEMEAA